MLEGRRLSDIEHHPWTPKFEGHRCIQCFLDWVYQLSNHIRNDAVRANVVRFLDENSADILKSVLSSTRDQFSFEVLDCPDDTGDGTIRFVFRAEEGRIRLMQVEQPDQPVAGTVLDADFLDIPYEDLKKECLRAYAEEEEFNHRIPDYAGCQLNEFETADLEINLPLARYLIAQGRNPEEVFLQYLDTQRSKKLTSIDITGIALPDLNFKDLDLMGVDLTHTIQTASRERLDQLRTAIIDPKTQDQIAIASSATKILAEPLAMSRRSLLEENAQPYSPQHFAALAVELQELHRRGKSLGNIDVNHLRFFGGHVFYSGSAVPPGPGHRAEKQDQIDFFKVMMEVCPQVVEGENNGKFLHPLARQLQCPESLKEELTLFLLNPELHELHHPLEEYFTVVPSVEVPPAQLVPEQVASIVSPPEPVQSSRPAQRSRSAPLPESEASDHIPGVKKFDEDLISRANAYDKHARKWDSGMKNDPITAGTQLLFFSTIAKHYLGGSRLDFVGDSYRGNLIVGPAFSFRYAIQLLRALSCPDELRSELLDFLTNPGRKNLTRPLVDYVSAPRPGTKPDTVIQPAPVSVPRNEPSQPQWIGNSIGIALTKTQLQADHEPTPVPPPASIPAPHAEALADSPDSRSRIFSRERLIGSDEDIGESDQEPRLEVIKDSQGTELLQGVALGNDVWAEIQFKYYYYFSKMIFMFREDDDFRLAPNGCWQSDDRTSLMLNDFMDSFNCPKAAKPNLKRFLLDPLHHPLQGDPKDYIKRRPSWLG